LEELGIWNFILKRPGTPKGRALVRKVKSGLWRRKRLPNLSFPTLFLNSQGNQEFIHYGNRKLFPTSQETQEIITKQPKVGKLPKLFW